MQKVCVTLLLGILTVPALALDDAVNTGRFNDTAIEGYDPVAYFTQGKPVKGSDEFEYAWRGGNWRFASQDSLERFRADPEKFAPQYGGWCAYAMSDRGRTVRIDPEAWTIRNGKLYLNYSQSVRNVWQEAVDANIAEANRFYPQTTDINEWLKRAGTMPATPR